MSIIIEPINVDGKSVVLVHYSVPGMIEDERPAAEETARSISRITGTPCVLVPAGIPNPKNPAGAYIVRKDNPEVMSAILKMCKQSRPGAFITLTDPEFDAFTDPENVIPV